MRALAKKLKQHLVEVGVSILSKYMYTNYTYNLNMRFFIALTDMDSLRGVSILTDSEILQKCNAIAGTCLSTYLLKHF